MKKLIFSILLLQLSATLFAQEKVHPIDAFREKCLSIDSNQTTYGMCDCEKQTQAKWEIELNVQYKKLMKILAPSDKELLILSQRDWLSHREKELKFLRAYYGKMEGTMWSIVAASTITDFTRNRVLELSGYMWSEN